MYYYKLTIDDNAPAPAQIFIKSKYPIRHEITFAQHLDCVDKNAQITEIKNLSKAQYQLQAMLAMPLNNPTDWDLFDKSRLIL